MATEPDVVAVSKSHGMVHARIQRRFGKTMSITRTIRELYDLRRQLDYETDMFARRYGGNIEDVIDHLNPHLFEQLREGIHSG